MIPAEALYFVRFLDYAFALTLFGYLFFYLVIVKENLPSREIICLFLVCLIGSLTWLGISALDMADSWELTKIHYAMTQTSFAHWWCIRIALLLLGLIIATFNQLTRKVGLTLLFISAALPFFSSLTGHAASSEDWTALRLILDFLHQLSAGIWLGGLIGIYYTLSKYLRVDAELSAPIYPVVKRFSHFALFSTAVLLLSGVVQTGLIESSISILWSSLFGKLIALKIFLFGASLIAAGVNQFIHLQRWQPGRDSALALAMRRELRFEIISILIVLAVTSVLTRTNLPGS